MSTADWRTLQSLQSDDVRGASSTVRLNIEKAVEIRKLFWLKNFVSYGSNFILDVWKQLYIGCAAQFLASEEI